MEDLTEMLKMMGFLYTVIQIATWVPLFLLIKEYKENKRFKIPYGVTMNVILIIIIALPWTPLFYVYYLMKLEKIFKTIEEVWTKDLFTIKTNKDK